MTVKGNTAICGGKRLSSKELKASNARHFLKDGDRLLQCGTKIYRTSAMDLRHQIIENVYNDYIYIFFSVRGAQTFCERERTCLRLL